uniref:LITAF domain-containing protein n=1 Tax=Amphilophus citrinellus TaxID=61819 RepID=A0A3Q0S7T2_AMPCI
THFKLAFFVALLLSTFLSEASRQPSAQPTAASDLFPPPPAYDASLSQTQPTAVVCQPQPVPIAVQYLRDAPGLVRCPHCSHLVTSKVTYVPGTAAWCWCVILALTGLICGFCLIPLMVRGMQDAHHSCPQCGNNLHIHKR